MGLAWNAANTPLPVILALYPFTKEATVLEYVIYIAGGILLFGLIRVFAIAPYFAWKEATEFKANSDARKKLIDLISQMPTNPTGENFDKLTEQAYWQSNNFEDENVYLTVKEFVGKVWNCDDFDEGSRMTRQTIAWIKQNAR